MRGIRSSGIGGALRGVLADLRALAVPPQCPACRRRIAAGPAFCLRCAREAEAALAGEWAGRDRPASAPLFRELVAAGPLSGAWGRAVRSYKQDPAPELGRLLARPLLAWLETQRAEAQALVPVPMAAVRRRERGVNPAERLAEVLADPPRRTVLAGALRRSRYRRPLRGLGAAERRTEVRGAFSPGPDGTWEWNAPPRGEAGGDSGAGPIRPAAVWLVDDVCTTGATLTAAAAALAAAGARVAGALVLGRTPRRRARPRPGSGRPGPRRKRSKRRGPPVRPRTEE